MKVWKEKYKDWEVRQFDQPLRGHPHHLRVVPTPEWVYFVRVCSFTFSFDSVEQIEEYLDFYSKKIHPSSSIGGIPESGWEFQTRFDELPLYLREEPKRQKVVKALTQAIKHFGEK